MEIEDFYKIFADMEDAQEARIKQLKADLMETIAANKAEQKKDLVTLSNNTVTISRQLEKLDTSKNSIDSQKLYSGMRTLGDNMASLANRFDDAQARFWWLVALILVLFGIVEYQIFNLPEQAAEQFYQTYYANQPKAVKNAKK